MDTKTLEQQTDLKKRLQLIKRETSDSEINQINVNMQPTDLRNFLAERTKRIIEKWKANSKNLTRKSLQCIQTLTRHKFKVNNLRPFIS